MKIINSHGDEINLDERFDAALIKKLISENKHSEIDSYLKTIPSYPSHNSGGVPIQITEEGTFIGEGESRIKAEKGLIIPAELK